MTDIEEMILNNQIFIMQALIYILRNEKEWIPKRNLEIYVAAIRELLYKKREERRKDEII